MGSDGGTEVSDSRLFAHAKVEKDMNGCGSTASAEDHEEPICGDSDMDGLPNTEIRPQGEGVRG